MATGTPKVTLEGIPLGGVRAYGWPLVTGTAPHRELWTITERQVADIAPLLGKVSTFKIEGPRETYEVKQLYPLRLLPNANPNLRTLEVVDKRWLISRRHIVRHFNLRRINGRKRFNDNNGQLQEENAVFDAELEFAAYSILGGKFPYSPRDVLRKVLSAVGLWDHEIRIDATGVEIRDLILDDAGDAALSIVLSQFPGAALFIDREGKAIVYDQLDGSERDVFDSLPAPQASGSVAGLVDYQHVRPEFVRVLFTPEIEVRVDAHDAGVSRTPGKLQLDKIAQSVDGRLDVVDAVTGAARTVGLGSWEQAEALWAAWGGFGKNGRTLSNEIMATHAASGFKQVEWEFATNPAGAPDDQSARRIASAVRSYRRDFALDDRAFGKLASLKPHRVAILNRLFGSRAPSPVYTDWIRVPTWKGISEADTRGWDIPGGVAIDEDLSDGQVAPATVSEIAPGMFHVEPRQQDWGGLSQATFFGRPTDQIPSNDLGGSANRTGSDYLAVAEALELDSAFRMSLIMTAVPGSPNDESRMHSVDVYPTDFSVVDRVSGGLFMGPALGPPITIRVPASLMTARFAYSDNLRRTIEEVVTQEPDLDVGPGEDPADVSQLDALSELLVNEDFVNEFANASAAAVYARFLDRPLGSQSVDMRPGIEPTGALSRVRHEMVGGVTRTVLDFTEPSQLASVFRFLDQGVRRTLLGEDVL